MGFAFNFSLGVGFGSNGVGQAPVNDVAPVVSGLLTEGSTLSCTTGTWSGAPTITYAYQWRRNGVDIGGATSSTYVLVLADMYNNIDCLVTATNSFGNGTAPSNSVFAFQDADDIFGANLYEWWDFTDLATQSISSGLINSITSKGTNAAVFSSSATERPQSVVGINGLPVANFDGINDFIQVAASTGMYNFLHDTQGGTVIMVFKANNTASRLLNNRGTLAIETSPGIQIVISSSSDFLLNTLNELNTNPAAFVSRSIIPSPALVLGEYQLFASIYDNNNATLSKRNPVYIDNSIYELNSDSGVLSSANAAYNLTFGKRLRLDDNFFEGDLAEIIIANSKATPTQITQITTYLEYKYGGTFPIV